MHARMTSSRFREICIRISLPADFTGATRVAKCIVKPKHRYVPRCERALTPRYFRSTINWYVGFGAGWMQWYSVRWPCNATNEVHEAAWEGRWKWRVERKRWDDGEAFDLPLVRCMRECSSGKTVSERSLAVELLLRALVWPRRVRRPKVPPPVLVFFDGAA